MPTPAAAGPIPQSPPRHPTPSPEPQRRPPTKNQETSQRTHIQRLKASPPSHTTRPLGSRGIGPERALEAIHKKTCAQRKSRSSPELTCERRTDPAQPPTASHPIARTKAQTPTENPETSQHTHIQRLKASPLSHITRPAGIRGIGPERALEAIHKKPCAQRKSRSSPELTCERRTDPAEPPTASHPIARTTAQPPQEKPRNLSAHPYP